MQTLTDAKLNNKQMAAANQIDRDWAAAIAAAEKRLSNLKADRAAEIRAAINRFAA